jgi:hypothetical protein
MPRTIIPLAAFASDLRLAAQGLGSDARMASVLEQLHQPLVHVRGGGQVLLLRDAK